MRMFAAMLLGFLIQAQNPEHSQGLKAGDSMGCFRNDQKLQANLRSNHAQARVFKDGYAVWYLSTSANVFFQRIDFVKLPCKNHTGWWDYQVQEVSLFTKPLPAVRITQVR